MCDLDDVRPYSDGLLLGRIYGAQFGTRYRYLFVVHLGVSPLLIRVSIHQPTKGIEGHIYHSELELLYSPRLFMANEHGSCTQSPNVIGRAGHATGSNGSKLEHDPKSSALSIV